MWGRKGEVRGLQGGKSSGEEGRGEFGVEGRGL